MFFQKKLERSMKWQREQNALSESDELHEEDLPTMEELREEGRSVDLEKSDLFAMILSAVITIIPVCAIVLLILCSVMFLFI